uniref:Importin N-terminal domain-containing protein n=1 Tax=Chlamydomonas leiostraca TaxID=1034604 RepID=A0A7S0WIF6_9CHLO|mmetsp:Transcript_14581/g.36264  ORF Transcript_14581/g.36264 Transcript_14581/m.36264 type:complete len:1110 (+) Transcript_14581:111-3440(+)
MASSQQLMAALHALYHNEDPAVKEQANKWLEGWQGTVEAWSVSDAVLHDPGSNMEAQYFCAQTLRTKVARDFEELPDSAVNSLRDSLMVLLLKYAKGAPPVRTQLCLALTALTVHVPADKWGDGGPVAWFASRLQGQAADAALPCLLELLTVLPQEVSSFRIAVRPERRRQHAQELRGTIGVAIDILTSCLQQAPGTASGVAERLRPAVLQAFGGWLALSDGAALGPDGSQLPSHPLVQAALQGLSQGDPDVFHAAVDAACELVWCTVDPETAAVQPAMMPLIQALVPAIMGLRPRFSVAARRAREEAGEGASLSGSPGPDMSGSQGAGASGADEFDDGEEQAKGMARLFAEVGEAYIHLIATAVQEVQAPVEAMLEVAGHPDHTIASMSFNFWHKLAKALSSGFSPRSMTRGMSLGSGGRPGGSMMDVTAAETPEGESAAAESMRRRQFFAPAFERLVALIRGSVRYPAHQHTWGKEAHAEFRKQRYEVADSLEDCASMLGFSRCLALAVEPLAEATQGGAGFDWRTAEAVLFCVRAIAPHSHSEPPGEPVQLAQLLAALPTLPRTEHLLQVCVCYTIGRYAGWIGTGLNAAASAGAIGGPGTPAAAVPALLPALFGVALANLESPVTAPAASAALLDLCGYCGSHLTPCLQQLMELYNTLQGAGAGGALSRPAGAPAPTSGITALVEEDVQQVMQAVCIAVCKCLPNEQVPAAATTMLTPVLNALGTAAQQLPAFAAAAGTAAAAASLYNAHPYVGPLLDRLGALFSHISHRQAVADMLTRAWPVMDMVFTRAGGDVRLLERACRALRLGAKSAGTAIGPLLPALLEVLAARFRATRHSAFLYILSELIKVFGSDEGHAPQLAAVLSSLLVDACSGLGSLALVTANPELVDDTYLLATRAAAYAPHLLLWQALGQGGGPPASPLPTLLDTALVGVLVQHREACCSVLNFLIRLLAPDLRGKVAGADGAVQAALGPRAAMLVRLLLAGVVGVLPHSRLGDVAALLSSILRATAPPPGSAAGLGNSAGLGWLAAAVGLLPDTVVPQADKESLLGAAASECTRESGDGARARAWEGAIDDFADVCRRNPRVRTAAQQALLPPELAAAVVM